MGYSMRELTKIVPLLSKHSDKTVMCELGNSYIKGKEVTNWLYAQNLRDIPIGGEQHSKGIVSKHLWERIGYEYLSIDMNKLDGAHYFDLRKKLPTYLKNDFDIVLDVGTIEHVDNQYMAFFNVDYMTKVGGINIHFLPKVGTWPQHCKYYFDTDNFEKLADICGYDILNISEEYHDAGTWIFAALIKGDKEFPTEEEFETVGIHHTDQVSFDRKIYPYAYE